MKFDHVLFGWEQFTDRGVVDITVEADGVLRARIPTPTSGDAKPLMLEGDAVQHLEVGRQLEQSLGRVIGWRLKSHA